MTHVVLVCQDTIGERMAGPAIRAVELARCLASRHRVTLLARHGSLVTVPGVDVAGWTDDATLQTAVASADVVIAFGDLLVEHPWLAATDAMVVADLYDPAILEALVLHSGAPIGERWRQSDGALATLWAQLDGADAFLCASDRQRHLIVGMLAGRGRINPGTFDADPTFDQTVLVVPFGLQGEPPKRSPVGSRPLRDADPPVADDTLVVLWGGGIYEWFDPVLAVEAVASLDDPPVCLHLMGMSHPTPGTPVMPVVQEVLSRAEELGAVGRSVRFGTGWVPYEHRGAVLADADVGISLHQAHVETTYAFRTRLLDYFWAGLPVVCTEGDVLADVVESSGAGIVVPPGDVGAVRSALQVMGDRTARAAMAAASAALAQELRWEVVAAPLVELCAHPRKAGDRHRPPVHGHGRLRSVARRVARLRRDSL